MMVLVGHLRQGIHQLLWHASLPAREAGSSIHGQLFRISAMLGDELRIALRTFIIYLVELLWLHL